MAAIQLKQVSGVSGMELNTTHLRVIDMKFSRILKDPGLALYNIAMFSGLQIFRALY
jgi:hypothetical protein